MNPARLFSRIVYWWRFRAQQETLLPVRRARRIDPVVTLRAE